MTVSFCVIAYNEEKTMPSLFEDIRNQDYPHEQMEIVLVNAMSSDRTRQLMETFAQENNGFIRVLVVDNPKRIQAAGWNIAIREAQGDVIMRIDAHTMIPYDFVTKNVNCIEGGEYISGGPRPNIAEDDTPWKHTLLLAEKSMFGSSIASYRRGHHRTYVKSVFHGAYRKEVFENVGLFDERLGRTEDNEMHYRITQAGYKICYTPTIISYQNIRSSWRGMIKQKFGNGYWVGLTTGICRQCFSLYHFVPLCFVLAVFVTLILAIMNITSLALIILLTVYMLINCIMSVASVIKEKKHWQYIMLPFIFLSLHLSYGIGTVVGLIKMPFWYHRTKEERH